MADSLFIGGTASNAGKSWTATAIAAWLRRRGVRVAPFKAQTMSNHSYPCVDGGEIGRAQVAQAEACGLEPESAMNPILLKPNTNGTSQVIVRGKVWKTLAPREYYAAISELRGEVLAAYDELASRYDVVISEGAGSVSELNLRLYDLVNLWLVRERSIPWVLLADIERGGVFASVAGSVALLEPRERELLRGVMINKFQGDRTLFDEGRRVLERQTGVRCLGIWPFRGDIRLDAEDSLAVDTRATSPVPPGASIAIVHLPSLSNATDFKLLTWADWITSAVDRVYDFVILPGTKDTLGALTWLRERGFDVWLHWQYVRGATIIGVCGGFQLLGESISDPHAYEAAGGQARGMGLLPVATELSRDKTTVRRRAILPSGVAFEGYEIHHGVTSSHEALRPFAHLEDGSSDGARSGRVIGTYLHGALEDPDVCRDLFGVDVQTADSKQDNYSALAKWLDDSADEPLDWLPNCYEAR